MAEALVRFIESHGYWAVGLLMALENVFPPVPSELIMPFAGFVAAQGRLDPLGVVAAGVAGSLLGNLPWYWVGRRIGVARLERWAGRHGRWLTLAPGDVRRAQDWFERRGAAAVLGARMVPALRSVISAPAGIAGMSPPSFLAWSSLGLALWSGALTAIGYALEDRYDTVARWLEPVTWTVLLGGLGAYVWRFVRFDARSP